MFSVIKLFQSLLWVYLNKYTYYEIGWYVHTCLNLFFFLLKHCCMRFNHAALGWIVRSSVILHAVDVLQGNMCC